MTSHTRISRRDFLASTNPSGFVTQSGNVLANGKDETLGNNLFFSVGVTIMLPPTAKISD